MVAAFRAALLHQGLIALAIFAVLSVVWVAVRDRTAAGADGPARATWPEPAGHRVLRIASGLLWVFDGLLQAQPKMAAGMPSQVIEPIAASSPHWVAFDRAEGLTGTPDWRYLTGSTARLKQVYKAYGQPTETLPAGAMAGHSDIAFVIDTRGEIREELDMDPGPGTAATKASFATELADAASQTLHA